MIDYGRLQRSTEFYTLNGFTRVEVPWTVTAAVSGITRPPYASDMEIVGKNKVLVASGEQGFLYLYLKSFLPKGRFQAITPCFRDEPIDMSHTKYFMKNELIITDDVSEATLSNIVETAREFFEQEANQAISLIKTEDGYDLELNGYEIGSYGIRKTEFIEWVYGTGVAEPRMTMALRRQK